MSTALASVAQRIVKSALPQVPIKMGPWLGSMRSRPADAVPLTHAATVTAGRDFLYRPRTGEFLRRGGQVQRFDNFSAPTGITNGKWGAKARWAEEHLADSFCSDGQPTLAGLLTKETMGDGVLDDGRFGQVVVRDQVANAWRTVGDELSASTYPAAGAEQAFKMVPLWYDSGDGGITRATSTLADRFLFPGSRRFLKAGNWTYFPNANGTPCRWNGERAALSSGAISSRMRIIPSGPLPPVHAGSLASSGTVVPDGPWKGSDRFVFSYAFQFEDGSIWAPCMPRLPSTTLPNGLNLFTVDETNPTSKFAFIRASNAPIGPHGTIARLFLRGPKVDGTSDAKLDINIYDLRVAYVLNDNTTTTFDLYDGDDATLGAPDDSANLLVQAALEYQMPPRARYVAGGLSRVCHAYGGTNPCAVVVAPVGGCKALDPTAADFDRNLADDDASSFGTIHGNLQFFMRLNIAEGGSNTFSLVAMDAGLSPSGQNFSLATYDTIQKLVDAVNATTSASGAGQWRAQICPGVNPDANVVNYLTPHVRSLVSVVVYDGSTRITRASGGLSKIPIGYLASSLATGVTAGAQVQRIISDTELELTVASVVPLPGTVTTTVSFYADTGEDNVGGIGHGYQRVVSGALSSFLYFTKSYLNTQTFDKQSVWHTVATPGQIQSAPNCFTLLDANRHRPPNANAGVVQGVAPVDQGFVVGFANKIGVIRNDKEQGTGLDQDYHLFMLNENEGCCDWNTFGAGNRLAHYRKRSGVYVADLHGERLISEAIYLHPTTDAGTGVGDFAYDAPLSVASAAVDSDAQEAVARIMHGILWVNFRASGSTNDRQVAYDFSSGMAASGLESMFRDVPLLDADKRPVGPTGGVGMEWGWSLPIHRSFSAMCEVRRSDGSRIYGWNDENLGSAGDGRVDEFEIGDLDNGAQIASAEVQFPWIRAALRESISAQELSIEHTAPDGSTGFLDFHRSFHDDLSALTPLTGNDALIREVKMLPQAARCVTNACYVGYRQTAGAARNLSALELRLKIVRRAFRSSAKQGAGYGYDYGGQYGQ